jgi:hypothetical protein
MPKNPKKRKKLQERKGDRVKPKKTVSREEAQEASPSPSPFSEQLDQYSSLELQQNPRTLHRHRELKAKAPSVASSDSLSDSRKLMIWLDVKERRPKPPRSDYNTTN